ncbi:MAG: TolC family outer membrane protein [Methyloglobulus sp.]|nr:TolC family outer membrane protein [Methyloglobulus sp.]
MPLLLTYSTCYCPQTKAIAYLFKKAWIGFLLLCLTGFASTSHADDLLSIYHQALQADPTTQSAHVKVKIGEAQKEQAKGQMLPQVTGSANWSTNYQTFGNNPTNNYGGTRYYISLNQTLIDFAKFWNWRKAKATESQYEREAAQAEQNLLFEVTDKYFSVLEAEDELSLYQSEAEITGKEARQIQQQYDKQMVKVTDLYAIQAKLDQINAAAVEAEAKAQAAKQALQQLTNASPVNLAKLKDHIDYKPLEGKLEDWLAVARSENPAIAAQGYAIAAAEHDVDQQQAGHYPVVEAQLNYYNTDIGYQNQRTGQLDNQVAAINVNVPIFSGGATHQRVQEAKHRLTLNQYGKETKLRELNKITSEAYLNANASVKRIKANQKALSSASKSSDAMATGFNYGVQTLNDVLKAQDEEFQALQDLSKAKYGYVKNRMKFLQAIGSISEDNLKEVNSWLEFPSQAKTRPTAQAK